MTDRIVWPTGADITSWAEDPSAGSMRVEITDAGRDALMRAEGYEPNPQSDAMRFLRRRIELSGRLSLIEQAHWFRTSHPDTDSSSAQPHRFKDAE
jgi:hypothetical protein